MYQSLSNLKVFTSDNIYVQNSMSFCPVDPDSANNSAIDLHPKHTVFHNKACNIPQVR